MPDVTDIPSRYGHVEFVVLVLSHKSDGTIDSHEMKVVSGEPKTAALISVPERMTLCYAPHKHGDLFKGIRMRIFPCEALKRRANNALDEVGPPIRPSMASVLLKEPAVEEARSGSQQLHRANSGVALARSEAHILAQEGVDFSQKLLRYELLWVEWLQLSGTASS